MFKDELKKFVEDNPRLVRVRPAGENLSVLKYSKSVFYDNLWNPYIEECRGTIVDQDFNVVSRPFTKIYNYGIEKQAPVFEPDAMVTAYRKVNGFMVAMTWKNNDILISTTGSTDSDYVNYAREMMLEHQSYEDWQLALTSADTDGMTFMFECVHPEDPHIVPEQQGMYFLGWRENTWHSQVRGFGDSVIQSWQDFARNYLNCYPPEAQITTMADLLEQVKTVRHEGFVFYDELNRAAKIKSPYYLTSKWVARNPRTDKLVDMKRDIKKSIDEEYHPLIDAIRENIEEYTKMDEQARLAWVRTQLEIK